MRSSTDLPRRPAKDPDVFAAGMLLVFGFPALLVVFAVIGGVVLHYAWDVVILHTFVGAPHIGIAQAIGLSSIFGYYTHRTTDQERTKQAGTYWAEVFFTLGMFLGTIWVLHFFIPGA